MAKRKQSEASLQWADVNRGVKARKAQNSAYLKEGKRLTYEEAGAEADAAETAKEAAYEERMAAEKVIREAHYTQKAKEKAKKYNDMLSLAKDNLCNFRSIFLENDKDTDLLPAEFHYRFSEHLINGKDNIAILGFRGCGKSEYVLRAFPLYCLAFPHKDRDFIVILKYNDDQAKEVIKSKGVSMRHQALLNITSSALMNLRRTYLRLKYGMRKVKYIASELWASVKGPLFVD